jgi:Tripartite tricarboxylate transporter family receptor
MACPWMPRIAPVKAGIATPPRTVRTFAAVVRAPPDGYTLLLVTPANVINATLYEKLNFNFIRDTAPVGGIIRVPLVVQVKLASILDAFSRCYGAAAGSIYPSLH